MTNPQAIYDDQLPSHALAFNDAARTILREREEMIAAAEGRKPQARVSSASEVARILQISPAQWQTWCIGRQKPAAIRVIEWLRRWAGAGLPELEVVTSYRGVIVQRA